MHPRRRPALPTRTPAERLDEAVDRLLTGHRQAYGPELAPLVDAASIVRAALGPVPAGSRFEARLASRLAGRGAVAELLAAIREVTREVLRHPARIVITGVLSSAAVGVGVTLLAIRRGGRRHAQAGHQPAPR